MCSTEHLSLAVLEGTTEGKPKGKPIRQRTEWSTDNWRNCGDHI